MGHTRYGVEYPADGAFSGAPFRVFLIDEFDFRGMGNDAFFVPHG